MPLQKKLELKLEEERERERVNNSRPTWSKNTKNEPTKSSLRKQFVGALHVTLINNQWWMNGFSALSSAGRDWERVKKTTTTTMII